MALSGYVAVVFRPRYWRALRRLRRRRTKGKITTHSRTGASCPSRLAHCRSEVSHHSPAVKGRKAWLDSAGNESGEGLFSVAKPHASECSERGRGTRKGLLGR